MWDDKENRADYVRRGPAEGRAILMKKIAAVLLILCTVAGAAIGGSYYYIAKSKTPAAIAARTLANLQEIESASVNVQVDTDFRAEVALLQFIGIKDPETTVSVNCDIEMYKEPAIAHAVASVNAFEKEALKDIEMVMANEDGKVVQYYRLNDKWLRYVPDTSAAKAESGSHAESGAAVTEAKEEDGSRAESGAAATEAKEEDGSQAESPASVSSKEEAAVPATAQEAAESTSYGKDFGSTTGSAVDSVPASAAPGGGSQTAEAGTGDGEAANDGQNTEIVDFDAILQGISDGSLAVTLREETEIINDKECFVFDIDLTGDMLGQVIRVGGGDNGIIPKLNKDEHVTGQFYIDSGESLPTALMLKTGEIFSEKLSFEQIGTTLSATGFDIKLTVTGYNLGGTVNVPDEYVDVDNIDDFSAPEMLNLVMDIIGLSGIAGGEAA